MTRKKVFLLSSASKESIAHDLRLAALDTKMSTMYLQKQAQHAVALKMNRQDDLFQVDFYMSSYV